MDLDKVPLWRLPAAPASASQADRARDAAQAGRDHVAIRQLVEDFGRYLYLPRVRDPEVLLGAIRGGFSLLTWEKDSFAYAESYDEEAGRYRGLRGGQRVLVVDADSPGLLVKSEIARKQLDAETRPEPTPSVDGPTSSPPGPDRYRQHLPKLPSQNDSTAPSSSIRSELAATPVGSPTKSSHISRALLVPT
jgi:hypothetical protein